MRVLAQLATALGRRDEVDERPNGGLSSGRSAEQQAKRTRGSGVLSVAPSRLPETRGTAWDSLHP